MRRLNPQADFTEMESDGEVTQVLPEQTIELTRDDPSEETQAIQFLDDLNQFFDAEPTSKLVIDGLLNVDDSTIEVDSVN